MKSPVAVLLLAASLALTPAAASANLLSPADESVYTRAFSAVARENFRDAHEIARRAHDPLLAKVIRWLDYTRPNSGALFAEITAFIRENPDWPLMSVLRRRAEEAITVATPDADVLAWFADHAPATVDGKIALGKALLAAGRKEEAVRVLRDAWVTGNFGPVQERHFLSLYGDHLRQQDHRARLDRLLWDRLDSAAQRMLLKVDMPHRLLAKARLALMNNEAGVDGAVARVPKDLQNDPGLVFERVRWRRRKDMDEGAIELMRHPSANKVRPGMWWEERSILARRALQKGHISQAYRLARDHGQSEGAGFADAEWLAGWIALRFLEDREVALRHFERLYAKVSYPVSRARGAYWAGRAAESMKDAKAAETWYRRAAEHVTTFYGQLAAAKIDRDGQWSLPADPLPTAEDIAAFDRHPLARAVRMLAEVGLKEHIPPFVVQLSDLAETPGWRALAATLAVSSGRADAAVTVARRAEREGVPMVASGFPIPALQVGDEAERALVLALIRQESGFHYGAVSSAGARGLMQLMPATAQRVAKNLQLGFSREKLVTDPGYNVRLGTSYLQQVLGSFDGSYVLGLAAYNAGPTRVRRWLKEYGDPRHPDVDAIDWIESIPFSETRNYVQRVLESLQVYRQRLGATDFARSLERDLKR